MKYSENYEENEICNGIVTRKTMLFAKIINKIIDNKNKRVTKSLENPEKGKQRSESEEGKVGGKEERKVGGKEEGKVGGKEDIIIKYNGSEKAAIPIRHFTKVGEGEGSFSIESGVDKKPINVVDDVVIKQELQLNFIDEEIEQLLVEYKKQILNEEYFRDYGTNLELGKEIFFNTLGTFFGTFDESHLDYYNFNFTNVSFTSKIKFDKIKINFPESLLLNIIFNYKFNDPKNTTTRSFGYIYIKKSINSWYPIDPDNLKKFLIDISGKDTYSFECGIGFIMEKFIGFGCDKIEDNIESIKFKISKILPHIKNLESFRNFIIAFDSFIDIKKTATRSHGRNNLALSILLNLFQFLIENKDNEFGNGEYERCIKCCLETFRHFDYTEVREIQLEKEMHVGISKKMLICMLSIKNPIIISYFFIENNLVGIRNLKLIQQFVFEYSSYFNINNIDYDTKLFVEIYNHILSGNNLDRILRLRNMNNIKVKLDNTDHIKVFNRIIENRVFAKQDEQIFTEIFFSFFDMKYVFFLKILFDKNIFIENTIDILKLKTIPDVNKTMIFYLPNITKECYKLVISEENTDSDIKKNTLIYALNNVFISTINGDLDKVKNEFLRLIIVYLLTSNDYYRKYLSELGDKKDYFILTKRNTDNNLAYLYILRRELKLIIKLLNDYNFFSLGLSKVPILKSSKILEIDDGEYKECYNINLISIDNYNNVITMNSNYTRVRNCVLRLALGFMLIIEKRNVETDTDIRNLLVDKDNSFSKLQAIMLDDNDTVDQLKTIYDKNTTYLTRTNLLIGATAATTLAAVSVAGSKGSKGSSNNKGGWFGWFGGGGGDGNLIKRKSTKRLSKGKINRRSIKRKSNHFVKRSIKRKSNHFVKRSIKRKSTTKRRSLKRKIN